MGPVVALGGGWDALPEVSVGGAALSLADPHPEVDPRTLARGDVLFLPAHDPVTVELGRRVSFSVGTGTDALRVHVGPARV